MATLDEITKEKQRLSEALVRVDEQREKLPTANWKRVPTPVRQACADAQPNRAV